MNKLKDTYGLHRTFEKNHKVLMIQVTRGYPRTSRATVQEFDDNHIVILNEFGDHFDIKNSHSTPITKFEDRVEIDFKDHHCPYRIMLFDNFIKYIQMEERLMNDQISNLTPIRYC